MTDLKGTFTGQIRRYGNIKVSLQNRKMGQL